MMSGSKILIDTNIVLYLFNGDQVLAEELQGRETYLSFVNELELLGHRGITTQEAEWMQLFLEDCSVMNYNNGIRDITVDLRRKYNLKLPDAIIAATAIFLGIPLISSDVYFSKITELLFIQYQPDSF